MDEEQIRNDGAEVVAGTEGEASTGDALPGTEGAAEEGATGEEEVVAGEQGAAEEGATGEEEVVAEAAPVETAFYRITGLVDAFDEQMNIISQYPIGSKQELPVEYGSRMVEAGYAEAIGTDEE